MQRFLLAHGPDAAGDALAARLVAEELGDAEHGVDEIRPLAVDDHDARAERRAGVTGALEGERQVELVGSQERAGGAAEEDGLRRLGAGELEQLGERRAELELVQTRPRDVARDAEETRVARRRPPSRMCGTLRSVSTLFTTVGFPYSPTSTGNGGLLRGSPR